MAPNFDLVIGHTSFLGFTGYAHHAREFFTHLNKYIPVRIRNFSHTSDISYLSKEQQDMIIYQTWDMEPRQVGTPYHPDDSKEVVNVVLNDMNHYFFYDLYVEPKVAYNVWESSLYPLYFFNKLLQYDQLWVPSRWQRNCAIMQGYPPDKVKIVWEGIDSNKFCPGESPVPQGYHSDRFKFLLIGRWEPRKSTLEIIKAFLEEFKPSEPVDLFIHVDNPWGKNIDGLETTEQRLAHYNLIDDRIKILRNLEKVENDHLYLSYLRNANCFVSCARSEGWNIPLIHAIAVGIPTICSDYSGQLEFADGVSHKVKIKKMVDASKYFMQENIPGEVAEPDFEHLKYVMRYCYEHYEECKRYALEKSAIVREKFTWDNAVKQALSHLSELHDFINKKIRINVGCGGTKKKGYINIDKYVSNVDIQCDAMQLSLNDNSVDEIYASHLLEHLNKADVDKVLREFNRVLKYDGVLKVIVPDFESCVSDWLKAPEEERWEFLHDRIFGCQEHDGEIHRTGFTKDRLRKVLDRNGFYVDGISDTYDHGQKTITANATKKFDTIVTNICTFYYNFCDGPFLEIKGIGNDHYKVEFINKDSDYLEYTTTLGVNQWARAGKKYFINWLIRATNLSTNRIEFETDINLENKRVMISLESKSLGDNIAWFPYVEEFRKKHKCQVIVSTFWNKLFKDNYPELQFIEPGTVVNNLHSIYRVGAFDNDLTRNKMNWRIVPLQKVSSDILGLEYREIRPLIVTKNLNRQIKEKYVAITQHSTFHAKYWLYPNGWEILFDYLIHELNYKIVVLSTKPPIGINDSNKDFVIDRTNLDIFDTINYIKNADFFIGISTGPTWLAWALNVPTILISGFSSRWAEMQDCERVINENVCNGCFNDPSLEFERGNWYFCPRRAGFECSKLIHPDLVINAINNMISKIKGGKL